MSDRAEPEQTAADRAQRFRPWVIPVVIVILSAVAAWGVFAWRTRVIDEETQQRLDVAARDSGRAIVQGLEDYAAHLQSVAAFWSVDPEATREDVSNYGKQVDLGDNYRTEDDVSLVMYVPDTQVNSFIASEQAMYPEFNIKPSPSEQPASTYYPITARLDGTGDEVVGTNLGVSDQYRAAFEQARNEGVTVVSEPLVPTEEDGTPASVADEPRLAMVTPVYLANALKDTVQDRRNAISGFTTTNFTMEDFLKAIDPSVGRAVKWAVYDLDGGQPLGSSSTAISNNDVAKRVIDVPGRKWEVWVEPAEGFVSASSKLSPYLAAAFVFAMGLVFAFFAWWIALGRDRLTRQVDTAIAARSAAEQRFRAAFEDAPIGVALLDLRGKVLTANSAAALIAGRGVPELLGQNVLELMEESTRPDAVGAVDAITKKGRHSSRFECSLLLPEGGLRRCRVSVGRSADPTDGNMNLLIHLEDISVEHALAVARDEAEQRFRAAFDDAPVGMALLDLEGRFLQVNDAFADMLGYSMSTLVGRRIGDLTHAEHTKADRAALGDVISGLRPSHSGETQLLRIDGEAMWVLFQTTAIREGDVPRYVLTHVQDITERKSYEVQLRYMADHDPLTGLFNRRRFEEELQRQLGLVSRYGPDGALLMLDLDHFKEVNDTLGHHAGDRLIRSVADLLRRRFRETDVLARLGGDEFAILLPRANRAEAEHLAEIIVEAVRNEVELANGDRNHRVTTSVGVTLLDDPSLTWEEVVANADLTMYEAKETGRNRYRVYSPSIDKADRARVRLAWAERIRRALDEDRFVLHAQPVVDIRTGATTQYELLVRMLGEDGELLAPSLFLPVAERNGLISRLDWWVVERAVAMLASDQRTGRWLALEVNMAAATVADSATIGHVEALLRGSGVDPTSLIFEVPEKAAVADIEAVRAFARSVASLGCRFSIDDFGAGSGGFHYLRDLSFDFLKIDGNFVAGCRQNSTDQLVIEAVVRIARGLGKRTVAEAVGDAETLAYLASIGVDLAQGHHLGSPTPVEDVFALDAQLQEIERSFNS
jgi:diguanylate cyclase (GGDEF)-like protein/PAS domain S-box-containing protein